MESSRGTVIRLTKLTDTSLIVTWLTLEHGLIKTVAKGARGSKSVFSGKIDLFVEAEIEWQRAKRGDLHHLREVTVGDYRMPLRRSYRDISFASYFGKLLGEMVEEDFPVPDLADLFRRALGYLVENGADRKALLHFEKELGRQLGNGPHGMFINETGKLSVSCLSARESCLKMVGA